MYTDNHGGDAFRAIWMAVVILFGIATAWALTWKLYEVLTRRHIIDEFDAGASFSVRGIFLLLLLLWLCCVVVSLRVIWMHQIQAGARGGASAKPKKERLRSLYDFDCILCSDLIIFFFPSSFIQRYNAWYMH